MLLTLKLARRLARFRAVAAVSLLFGAAACDNDRLGPAELDPVPAVDEQMDASVTANVSFAGGIPIGISSQPSSAFGPLYNGSKLTLKPWELLPTLAAIKARGGRVVLSLSGNPRYFRDANGHFDLNKWKARVDRFRRKNFASYIKDGTLFGHYLIDEPNDPSNWNGRAIPPSTVEEMAKYSKQIWPNLATIVRAESSYMAKWSGTYRYLDAAWAAYVYRKGDVGDFLSRNVADAKRKGLASSRNVADAKRKGLALVVGLNLLKGGPNLGPMTASQVRTWGSKLLSSSYPCAFISWQYDANYLSSSSMREAMTVLRGKAQNRATKTCRS